MSSSQHPRPSLDKLPAELLHLILLDVFPDDIKALRCVCHQLNPAGSGYPTREPGFLSDVSNNPIGSQWWKYLRDKVAYKKSVFKEYASVRKTVGQTLSEDAANKTPIKVQGDQKL
ncbi:hypothetical protein D6C99_01450 [Aureobasidium pullulans]|nr:hypothetical protein D6C99_01450 [Aureobasidium pullulans]